LTVELSYAGIFFCQAENTLSFELIWRADFPPPVENFGASLWINLWKTRQAFSNLNLKNRANFA
jgi:hypothetical protein